MTVPIRRSAVYWVPDTAVALPPLTLRDRNVHPRRPFLVISADPQNTDPSWPVVLGFPLTTSNEFASEFDVHLNVGQAGLKAEGWVRVSLLQPVAKTKLMSRIGGLDANATEECLARLLAYMGAL